METDQPPRLSVLQVLEKGRFSTGSVVQMFELARGLAARGHRVAIVSRPEGEVRERARAEGLEFIPLPMRHEFDLSSAQRLGKIYRDRSVDIVHAHKGIAHSVALFATFFSRAKPAIVVNRGVSFPLDPFNRLKYHVRMDAVVTVCEDIRQVVIASGRLSPEKVHVVYAGVDLARFDPARADGSRIRREWGISEHERLLLQVGAREWKGWRHLLEAARLLAPAFPHLVTAVVACENAAEEQKIGAVAREKGIGGRVRTIGFRSDMPDVLAAADVVADMSYEGLGITGTLRESMALGRPVIASAAGGNPELIQDEISGLLVPPRDPEALAGAVSRLLEDPALRARLALRGRERVTQSFSTDVRLDRIETLYGRLIAERAKAGAKEEARSGHR